MSYVRDKMQSNDHYHKMYDVIRILKGFLYDNEQLTVHFITCTDCTLFIPFITWLFSK